MKLKKGFTLIELVVVIALIAILAVTLAPRLRDQIAKAGDAKAIAILGSMRTQSEIFYAENTETVEGATVANYTVDSNGSSTAATTELDILINGLDRSSKDLFAEPGANALWTVGYNTLPTGGYRDAAAAGKVNYKGTVDLTFDDPTSGTSGDGIYLWFKPIVKQEQDTKGTSWASY